MIVTQTPLRIGLVGGGTDLPDYYVEHGGRVLNCAIDKYVYVIVKQRFDDDIYVNYSKKEIVSSVEDLNHDLVREAMLMTGVKHGVEITMLADIPSSGSGLGSSSSVTVGLLHALSAYQGRPLSGEELAEQACTIEIDLCGKRIGKQDQYIAALGGIRDLRLGPGPYVVADEIELSPLDRRMLLVRGQRDPIGTKLSQQILQQQAQPGGRIGDEEDSVGRVGFQPHQVRDARAGTDHLRAVLIDTGEAEEQGVKSFIRLAAGSGNFRRRPVEPGVIEIGLDGGRRGHGDRRGGSARESAQRGS